MPSDSHPAPVKDTAALQYFSAHKMQKVNLFETPRMFCDIYCLKPGQSQKVHAHPDADKVYFVLQGTATITIGDTEHQASQGSAALAPADVVHGVRNAGAADLVCLVFMAPNPNS